MYKTPLCASAKTPGWKTCSPELKELATSIDPTNRSSVIPIGTWTKGAGTTFVVIDSFNSFSSLKLIFSHNFINPSSHSSGFPGSRFLDVGLKLTGLSFKFFNVASLSRISIGGN